MYILQWGFLFQESICGFAATILSMGDPVKNPKPDRKQRYKFTDCLDLEFIASPNLECYSFGTKKRSVAFAMCLWDQECYNFSLCFASQLNEAFCNDYKIISRYYK